MFWKTLNEATKYQELKKEILKGNKPDILGNFVIAKQVDNIPKGTRAPYEIKEGKWRHITYVKDPTLRKELGKANKHITGLVIDNQHGFTTKRSIITAWKYLESNKIKGMINFDLQDAFNQITINEVYYIFRKILDLNKEDALVLTYLSTKNGYLFQGNPLSPTIFNIAAVRMMKRLKGLENEELKIASYADDINITSTRGFISWKLTKLIAFIIKDSGFKTNKEKFEGQTYKKRMSTLGISFSKNKGNFLPRKSDKLKRKIKFLTFTFERICTELGITKAEAKCYGLSNNDSVKWVSLINGLQNWQCSAIRTGA